MEALGAFARAEDVRLDRSLYTMIELEGRRYGAFFAKLDARGEGSIPRAAAVGFFAKSALSDAQVTDLYERIKGVGLLPDPQRVSAAEFTMAMHLIVCITKRSLTKIPPVFPTYLFPTLDLTPAAAKTADDDVWSAASAATTPSASAFNAFPSPSPSPSAPSALLPAVVTGFAAMNMDGSNDSYHDTPKLRMEDLSTSSSSLSAALSASKLADTRSLTELVQTEVRHRKAEETVLSRLEHSEMRTLQRLHSCLDQIASQVDSLGFPVPTASRTLDALDDLSNLFTKHVHAVKQEIQSMEISAQMMTVASERTESMRGTQLKPDPLQQVAELTEELVRLQQQVQTLFTRRDALSAQVEVAEAASRSSSASTSTVTASTLSLSGVTASITPTPTPSLDAFSTLAMSGGSSSTDVFSVASSATNVTTEATVDDPWAALSAPAPPDSMETLVKPEGVGNLSASLPSHATSTALADDWGTFSAPLSQSEGGLATLITPSTTAADEIAATPATPAALGDDWGTFKAPASQQESAAGATSTPNIADTADTAVKPASPTFGDEWGSFSAPTSQQEDSLTTPAPAPADKTETASNSATSPAFGDEWGTFSAPSEPATSDATLPSSFTTPATPNALLDDWGTFGSASPQQKPGSASADPFGFGSPVAAASSSPSGVIAATDLSGSAGQPATATKDEFGWSDFQ